MHVLVGGWVLVCMRCACARACVYVFSGREHACVCLCVCVCRVSMYARVCARLCMFVRLERVVCVYVCVSVEKTHATVHCLKKQTN